MMSFFRSFTDVISCAASEMIVRGQVVEETHWQGVKPPMPMFEILDFQFRCQVPASIEELKSQIKPNLPWADNHFLERVSGEPLNPGKEYKNWPFYKKESFDSKFQTEGEAKFSHTYMERFWAPEYPGIRYKYGNTNNVLQLLVKEPFTRQAFLPVWFPEDTGATHGGRVPCTLGYHFMRRGNQLHMWYPLRSCDFFRHFPDDIYMACRFLLWMIDELFSRTDRWREVRPGRLHMNIYSLHVFSAETPRLRSFIHESD